MFNIHRSLLLVAVIAIAAGFSRADDGKLVIMPLGDSNTRGTYPVGEAGPHPASIGAGGYRLPLQQMLKAGGHSFDFVGSQTSNAVGARNGNSAEKWIFNASFDREHQGLAGFKNQGLLDGGKVPAFAGDPVNDAPPLKDALALYKPNIILLMSGTNDMGGRKPDPTVALEKLDYIIRTIGNTSPNSWVIVSTVFPRWWTTDGRLVNRDKNTDIYNSGIKKLAMTAKDRGERIVFVDCGGALSASDFDRGKGTDGVHPNPLWLEKVAKVWYAEIENILRLQKAGSHQHSGQFLTVPTCNTTR